MAHAQSVSVTPERHGAQASDVGVEPHALSFVPHLVPLDRGILSTMYIRLTPGTTEEVLAEIYQRAYADAPFVRHPIPRDVWRDATLSAAGCRTDPGQHPTRLVPLASSRSNLRPGQE